MTRTIIRARRRRRFVVVDQGAIEDTRLSWAARGLLAYLLSLPDDWQVHVRDLRRRGNLGRDGIYKLLRELIDAGYVRYEKHRDAEGKIRGGTYYVSELPNEPHPDLPDAAQPDTAAPGPARPEALPSTKHDPRRTTTTTTTTNKGHAKIELAAWIPAELRESALDTVKVLDEETAQTVLDEWAGALAMGSIRYSPLGYLFTLAARAQVGEFEPKLAEDFAEWRHDPFITV